jgi:hypothetical protein
MEEEDRLSADVELRAFHLSDADLQQVRRCRGSMNRMGFAVQLCVLRTYGHLLKDMNSVPWEVLEHIARQLGQLAIPISDYPHDDHTRFDHNNRICAYLGFTRCDSRQRQNLLAFLVETAQITPKTNALRDAAHHWLTQSRIVRPGRTTLLDLIQTARETGLQRIYERLTDGLLPEQGEKIESLLLTPGENGRSRLEAFKAPARKESAESLVALLERLREIRALGLADLPALAGIHPAIRQQLAAWGYRHDVWSLRRFSPVKRGAIVVCFLQAARAEITDAIIEMQDKIITRLHNKAKHKRQEALSEMEQARTQAVAALETIGAVILDESITEDCLRKSIFAQIPAEEMRVLVAGCRHLRRGGEGSHLGFLEPFWEYSRRYSPPLLSDVPFVFAEKDGLGEAIEHLREVNRQGRRKLAPDAPTAFLARR